MNAEQLQAMIDQVAGECIAVRMRMLNRVITNIYDDALRPLDLKVSQMNILVAAAVPTPDRAARGADARKNRSPD